MRLWRFTIAVLCWVLMLLGFIFVMVPVRWLIDGREVSGRVAAVSGVIGLFLISVMLPLSFWWRRQRAAEAQQRGFPLDSHDG